MNGKLDENCVMERRISFAWMSGYAYTVSDSVLYITVFVTVRGLSSAKVKSKDKFYFK